MSIDVQTTSSLLAYQNHMFRTGDWEGWEHCVEGHSTTPQRPALKVVS